MTTRDPITVGIRRLQTTEFRPAGFAVDLQGKPGDKWYCYTLDEHGEKALTFDESERDVTHLSRLLAFCAFQGCELGISRGAEAALAKRLLQPPGAAPVGPTKASAKRSKRGTK